MIAKAHRFHGYGSLRYVYNRGQVVRGSLCMLKFAENPKRKTWRAAVVVSKKVHKSAVTRNRIRRRIYEIIRLHIPDQGSAYDLVWIIHSPDIATMSHDELTQNIVTQIKKAGLPLTGPKI